MYHYKYITKQSFTRNTCKFFDTRKKHINTDYNSRDLLNVVVSSTAMQRAFYVTGKRFLL